MDLRVDDHADPIAELWRLYEVAHERFIERVRLMPTRTDPAGHLPVRRARPRARATAGSAGSAGLLGVLEDPGTPVNTGAVDSRDPDS